MVFRIPTHLEYFVPPSAPLIPADTQSALTHPWRGKLVVSGLRASDIEGSQEIRVTAVETDGETPPSSSHLWPSSLIFTVTNALPILKQLQDYIRTAAQQGRPVPMCTFMPERQRDPDAHTVNQTLFRSLSRILWQDQHVAVVPFSASPKLSHSPYPNRSMGILIYPASNSTTMLIGAIFLNPSEGLPDFVNAAQPSHSSPSSLSQLQVSSSQIPMPSQTSYPHSYSTPFGHGRDEVPISPTVLNSRSSTRISSHLRASSSRQRSASESFRRHASPAASYGHGALGHQSQSLSPTSEHGESVNIRQFHHAYPHAVPSSSIARLAGSGGGVDPYRHPSYRSMSPVSSISGMPAHSGAPYIPSSDPYAASEGQYPQMTNPSPRDSASPTVPYPPEGARSSSTRSYTQTAYPLPPDRRGSGSSTHSPYGQ
ncbi:hypothetical protein D9758_010916 [Tetrapyrgos nigripes]|uniref:Uncharacterized protein n=1 Tax=Tetrapyrgos nigripes TaxID=182062 RepID=A0A8H5CUW4_9AGAR|nr:hypothetical protein D9758_010916 [Tetrapyrgos nigripes]